MVINTQFHKKKSVRACSMFYPNEIYRSVTPLDTARVNRTILHRDVRYRRFSMLPPGNNRKSDFDVTYR